MYSYLPHPPIGIANKRDNADPLNLSNFAHSIGKMPHSFRDLFLKHDFLSLDLLSCSLAFLLTDHPQPYNLLIVLQSDSALVCAGAVVRNGRLGDDYLP